MINNDYTRSATGTAQAQERRAVNNSGTGQVKGNPQFNPTSNLDKGEVRNGIMALAQQLLQKLHKGGNAGKPDKTPPTLNLSSTQESSLKNLLGFTNGAPVGVQVLDRNRDGAISAGDVAVVSGGITGGEILRHTLTAQDIKVINGATTLPADLTANRAKWEQATADGQSVSYTAQSSCFCPPDYTRPMNITEQNGRITDATYADTGEAVPVYVRDSLLTMNERFDQLQDAYTSGAEQVDVTYDAQLGYPSSVLIDQSFQMADEEIRYTIKDLQVGAA